ncbi:MAG: hypothetical protein WC758_02260 [Candidatus Woesearchaeota archaeon]|jgi:hypothetical protein
MTRALLLRPQYPYGVKQVWMPMDLIKVASKFNSINIESKIVDLNIENKPENISQYDYVGFGVMGPPYIPSTQELFREIKSTTNKPILIGGPGVEHFSEQEFKVLYPGAIQIANDVDFTKVIGKTVSSYDSSIVSILANMSANIKQEYLSNEFSFFVSQGCKYSCDFCAALRSTPKNPVREKFSSIMQEDLEAICLDAKSFNIEELSMYLSSLDLFQTPKKFLETLKIFSETSHKYDIKFNLRGLSRVDSFLNALDQEKEFYEFIPRAGLKIVGFGIDGTTEKVWKSQHKGIINLSSADKAYRLCDQLDIVPEALLVMGFHDKNGMPVDTSESLKKNVEYALDRSEKYNVVIRPHVAKDMIPGNNGWNNPVWLKQKSFLLENPKYFKNLDYVALASKLTHPDEEFRNKVNDAYLQIIQQLSPNNKCVTKPLLSYSGDESYDKIVDTFNMLIPSDR